MPNFSHAQSAHVRPAPEACQQVSERGGGIPLLLASTAYFVASTFGTLRLPVADISYANLALVILLLTSLSGGQFRDFRPALLLLSLAALDLLARVYFFKMEDIGYSFNIAKMALFVLVAQQMSRSRQRNVEILAIFFGLAAICSEVFVLFHPEYRLDLYNSHESLGGTDIGDELGALFYRPTGLFGDPNYFAVPIVILAVTCYVNNRYVWFVIATLLVAITGSRAAMLSILVPIVIERFYNARLKPFRLIFLSAIWVSIYVFASFLSDTLRGDTSDSNKERASLLLQGIDKILSLSFLHATYGEPLGLGLDGYKLVIHNTFIQTAVTSSLLSIYIIYRATNGILFSPNRLILGAIIVEMLFLDISSFSSIFFAFFIFSEAYAVKQSTVVMPLVRLHWAKKVLRFLFGNSGMTRPLPGTSL